jgi:homoserine O-acetyltransferase
VIGLLDLWVDPIKVDPKWNQGDYYGREEPVDGLTMALKTVTLTAGHWGWAEKSFGYQWADAAQDPTKAMDSQFKIEDVLIKTANARARTTDANHSIYMAKANQLYNVEKDIGQIKAKILFVPASSDLIFPPEFARKAADRFRAQGGHAEVFVIEGDRGHLDGVVGITKAGPAIREFLSK